MSTITSLRHDLAATLRAAGPGWPTLCEGWSTEQLLAHLLLRETRPDVAAGVVLPPLAGRTERKTQELAARLSDREEYAQAVRRFERLRTPLRLVERADAGMNVIEYLVHREDVVRGMPGVPGTERVRTIDGRQIPRRFSGLVPFRPDEQQLVWDRLGPVARMQSHRYPDGLTLVGTDAAGHPAFGEQVVRRPSTESRVGAAVQAVVRAPRTGAPTVLTGQPLELLLHLFGREEAAQVSVS